MALCATCHINILETTPKAKDKELDMLNSLSMFHSGIRLYR